MKTTVALMLLLLLSGCTPAALQVRPAPAVIESVRDRYVPVPAAMTNHGSVVEPKNKTEDELLNVAKARGSQVKQCYIQLDEIGALQGTPVK